MWMTKGRLIELAFIGAVAATLVLLVMRALPIIGPGVDLGNVGRSARPDYRVD